MFISIEGVEGAGKSSQAILLSNWLKEKNIDHILTKEPGTVLSKECQQIRHLLLSPENDLSPRAELMLYLADRAQHVDNCIKPALDAGKWVVSDRYSFSSYVYQGISRGFIDEYGELFKDMLGFAANDLWPDLTFIMDCPVEIGLKRAKLSNTEFEGGDRIERETTEFHQKLRTGFLNVAKKFEDRCVVLNAAKSINQIHEEIKKNMESRL